MTFFEIITMEDENLDKVFLHREGTFLKAYEHSAYLFHKYVGQFKLSYRFIKSINRKVVSLGFPEQSLKKWLYAYPVRTLSDKLLVCDIGQRIEEVEYHDWLELAALQANPGDRYTVHTSVIEGQPVYKTAYDAFCHILDVSKNIDKSYREPLAVQAKCLSYKITYAVRTLYDVDDRNGQIDFVQSCCRELMFVLQVLKDKKQISLEAFAMDSERIESVSKQLGGLRRTATA